MCGIAGKLIFDRPIKEEDINVVKRIRDTLTHRGPDDSGLTQINNAILAHRRLSIIDLSSRGKQPMSTIDKRYYITYNGEVYNFKEIKSILRNKGYEFKSETDTEVVLNAYAEYGRNCLNMFNGMFAFAIWDCVEKSIFMARDRFGKKPLFYHQDSHALTFSSEIKGLKADKTIKLKTSFEAINCYLAIGYILNPHTMYEDIYSLEPASFIKIDSKGKILRKEKYWNYTDCFRIKTKDSVTDIQKNITELLRKAINRRLISDVPVGAFLSGGLDSSSIVALTKECKTDSLHTFSVGFNKESYNELPDANKVGEFFDTIHHGIIVDKRNEIDSFLDEIIQVSDQLFADNSIIPMMEVSKLASKNVTVALSGDGADEMFAGYITYSADLYYQKAQMIPRVIRKILCSNNINLIPFSKAKLNFDYKRKQFFNGTLHNYRKAHYLWRQIFNEEEREKILGKTHKDLIIETDPFKVFNKFYESVEDLERINQHLYVDAMTWLTDDILTKVDRATMSSSIEARTPYLDIDLVSYAAGIPAEIKFKNGKKKIILKKALSKILPEFVQKKRKEGFNAPIHDWLPSTESNEFKDYNKFIFEKFIN